MDADFSKKLEAAIGWLTDEYSSIRTGQAAPGLLDGVKVESYGATMSLQQLGSIGIEDARTLRVSPWDAGQVASIERAIKDADLGVSVSSDSSGLRVMFPELTSERREQIKKLAKGRLEDARVRVRNVRDEAMKKIDSQEKDGSISKDDRFRLRDQVQKEVDRINEKLEALFTKKEQEISK